LSVSTEDRARDRARLEKELAETERLLATTRAKLDNEAFTAKAPAAVVDGVLARQAELQELAQRLRDHLEP
jgi:valyl-tRNA synthetase